MPGMQRYASPGEPLHVWHLGTFIDARYMMDFLLQNRERPRRRALPGLTSTYGRVPDPHSVPIDIETLVRQTHQNNHRSRGRDVGMPGIVPRFNSTSKWLNLT